MRFQSLFMFTMLQPLAAASSSALSRFPTFDCCDLAEELAGGGVRDGGDARKTHIDQRQADDEHDRHEQCDDGGLEAKPRGATRFTDVTLNLIFQTRLLKTE
jgi:hypothetical protein